MTQCRKGNDMNKSERKTRSKKSRSKPESDLYESVGGWLANAVWIFIVLALICFAVGYPGWGWCFLILSVVPVILFLVLHFVVSIICMKALKNIPHR